MTSTTLLLHSDTKHHTYYRGTYKITTYDINSLLINIYFLFVLQIDEFQQELNVLFLPSNSYKPIINTVWVRGWLCILQKGCIRLAATSDKVYQLLAHARWFSSGTPASSTIKTGHHDIAEIVLKVALTTINKISKIEGLKDKQ